MPVQSKMPSSLKTPLLLSLPLLVLAQDFPPYLQINGSSHGPHEGFETFQSADQNPDAKHSVTFDLNLGTSGREQWTWTLQSSNVSFPNISTSVPDAHVAYTTWHFSVMDSRQDPDTPSSTPTCVSIVDIDFPSNVSSSWDSNTANCTSAIGSECEQAILHNTIVKDHCDSSNFLVSATMDACKAAFGNHGITTLGYRKSHSPYPCISPWQLI